MWMNEIPNHPHKNAAHSSTYLFLVCFDHSAVDTGILNDKKQAPVHMATEMNKVNALKVMGKYRNIIDIQKGGEHGR